MQVVEIEKSKKIPKIIDKIKFDAIPEEKLTSLSKANHTNLLKIAIENSDAVIKGSEKISEEIENYLKDNKLPVLEYQPIEDYVEAYSDFYLTKVL